VVQRLGAALAGAWRAQREGAKASTTRLSATESSTAVVASKCDSPTVTRGGI
jgi:hypothetical protein